MSLPAVTPEDALRATSRRMQEQEPAITRDIDQHHDLVLGELNRKLSSGYLQNPIVFHKRAPECIVYDWHDAKREALEAQLTRTLTKAGWVVKRLVFSRKTTDVEVELEWPAKQAGQLKSEAEKYPLAAGCFEIAPPTE